MQPSMDESKIKEIKIIEKNFLNTMESFLNKKYKPYYLLALAKASKKISLCFSTPNSTLDKSVKCAKNVQERFELVSKLVEISLKNHENAIERCIGFCPSHLTLEVILNQFQNIQNISLNYLQLSQNLIYFQMDECYKECFSKISEQLSQLERDENM